MKFTALKEQEIQLWYLLPDQISYEQVECWLPLLSRSERQQIEEFHFEKDRKRYVLTRAMIRILLARLLLLEPRELRFEYNAFGRPSVSGAQNHLGLDFNISHADGMIVCALVKNGLIGVDVENTHKPRHLSVAKDFFSPAETEALFQMPAGLQQAHFYKCWTLKEAFIKATGWGLALPLDSFAFCIAEHGIQLTDYTGVENPDEWAFRLIDFNDTLKIALAVKWNNTYAAIQHCKKEQHEPTYCTFPRSGLSGKRYGSRSLSEISGVRCGSGATARL